MSDSISRAIYDAILPQGPIWVPKMGGDLDLLLNGMADNQEEVRQFLAALAFLRDPQKTTILEDLEKEFGFFSNPNLSEQERRDALSAAKGPTFGFGADYLQEKLQQAGFDLQVHINNPPVDPDLFLAGAYTWVFGEQTGVLGNQNCQMGGIGGELVVNGEIVNEELVFTTIMGGNNFILGNQNASLGSYDNIDSIPVVYTVPSDPGYWGLFFFVGGDATRDPVTGELLTIATADVPVQRRDELLRLIVKYKPLHSWCGLIVNYV